MNCPFCFQDRSSIDIKYIEAIPANLAVQLKQIDKKYTTILYRIWGGELFADDIPDSMFSLYRQLVSQLTAVGDSLGLKTQICFSSNLVFGKIDRVKRLIDETHAMLATSYDPKYRFHNNS